MKQQAIGATILANALLAVTFAWLLPDSHAGDKPAAKPETKIITNSIGMKLALIPAGKFTMGSPASEKKRDSDEGPQHEVEITKPFHMGVHEVTQEEYREVMGKDPSWFSADGDGKDKVKGMDTRRFPVEKVSWEDAREFCRKLSALPKEKAAGIIYRLPTEAEWEYGCRAGTKTVFHYGDSLSSAQANFDGNDPYGGAAEGKYLRRTAAVGSYPPNAFGLCDMHGNVLEWCADWYDGDYYKNSPRQDPENTKGTSLRVLRGGCWDSGGWFCRSANHHGRTPDYRYFNLGFRVVAVQSR